MYARKCMFGDKSTFGLCKNGKKNSKKDQQEKLFLVCTFNKAQ